MQPGVLWDQQNASHRCAIDSSADERAVAPAHAKHNGVLRGIGRGVLLAILAQFTEQHRGCKGWLLRCCVRNSSSKLAAGREYGF